MVTPEEDTDNLISENANLRSRIDGFEHVIRCMAGANSRLAMQNDFLRWMFVIAMIATRTDQGDFNSTHKP